LGRNETASVLDAAPEIAAAPMEKSQGPFREPDKLATFAISGVDENRMGYGIIGRYAC